MSTCSSCGRALPEGALFCPDCGAKAPDYSMTQSDVSPSHFNSGITATSQPQTTVAAPVDDAGFAAPPQTFAEEKRRLSVSGKRGLALLVIFALAVLLLGVSLEAGLLGSGGGGPSVNSASTPLTGQQLYTAYGANRSQADASYTNKTIFIRDSLDFGVGVDRAGQYFSSVNSGSVVLVWSGQAQVGQLGPGETVLAKCSVEGTQPALGGGYVLYLQNCDLISVQSQTTGSQSVSVANL